jgi:hypothetical protein
LGIKNNGGLFENVIAHKDFFKKIYQHITLNNAMCNNTKIKGASFTIGAFAQKVIEISSIWPIFLFIMKLYPML